jgi:hypothetical protein
VPTLAEVLQPSNSKVNAAFTVRATATIDGLVESIDDASIADQVVYFTAENDKLLMSAHGDLMSAAVQLLKNGGTLFEYETKQLDRGGYSLQFLSEIVKAAKANFDIVTVEYCKDGPLVSFPKQ